MIRRAGAHAVRVVAVLGLMAVVGCGRAPLVERAIAARGGSLPGVVREVDADVHEAFPGAWRWRTVFAAPDRYCWTIYTTREPDHYCFDGSAVRAFTGSRLLSTDASPTAALRTHARFMALANLDVLTDPRVHVASLAAPLPPGVVEALAATFDDGASYHLGFDGRGLLVWLAGPVDLAPFGRGQMDVRFDDFQPAGGFVLPRGAHWTLDGAPLADERARAVCVLADGLDAAAFRDPTRLPPCGADATR